MLIILIKITTLVYKDIYLQNELGLCCIEKQNSA
jgi:hypothetical protein